ncbi:MAG: undecaprenyl-phosphate glucose phosphotransferase [Chitinophagaceae bacterium]
MGSRHSFFLHLILLITDLVIINVAYITSYELMYIGEITHHFSVDNFVLYNLIWFISAGAVRLYFNNSVTKVETIYRQTAKTMLLQALIFSAVLFFNQVKHIGYDYEKFLLYCYAILTVLFIISRLFVTYTSEFFLVKTKLRKRIAIVGNNAVGQKLADFFSDKRNDYAFHGFFDDNKNNILVNADGKIIDQIEQYINYAVENQIEEIYSTILPHQHSLVKDLVRAADQKCIRLKFVPDFSQFIDTQYYLNYLGDIPVINLRKEPLEDIHNRLKKRVFDLLFSITITILLLSWLIPLIGLLIKLDSKGPVFYLQNRAGRRNKIFKIIKFRTMSVTESDHEFKQAVKDDPRVTRVGKFLRKTNLDEIPQFINVLFGTMSVVGPRPHVVKLNDHFMHSITSYMARHFVKPGIAGWAQVNGYRGETMTPFLMQKRIESDIWYLENWTLMLDIKIIFMTIINLFRGEENAY